MNTEQSKSIKELFSPEILENAQELTKRIEILKSLIEGTEIIPPNDQFLKYVTEDSIKKYKNSVLEVSYKLINYYLSKNLQFQEEIGSFKNLDENLNLRSGDKVELFKFNESFGMEFEYSDTTAKDGKKYHFFKFQKYIFMKFLQNQMKN